MTKSKEKPNLVIIIDGLNNEKTRVFEQEINNAITILNKESKKKNLLFVYKANFHTGTDTPNYVAEVPEVSFYEIIVKVLKEYAHLIRDYRTIIHIIHNTNDFIDFEAKEYLAKFLASVDKKRFRLNFYTNCSENLHKALDFQVVGDVYSRTTAGIQLLVSAVLNKTLKFLRGR